MEPLSGYSLNQPLIRTAGKDHPVLSAAIATGQISGRAISAGDRSWGAHDELKPAIPASAEDWDLRRPKHGQSDHFWVLADAGIQKCRARQAPVKLKHNGRTPLVLYARCSSCIPVDEFRR